MKPEQRRRTSNRLQTHDYAQAGAYFVTICTYNHLPLLARIRDNRAHLSRIGLIVAEEWRRTPQVRHNVTLDEFVIMPNHIHGILLIQDEAADAQPGITPPAPSPSAPHLQSPSQTIGAIVRGFKRATTSRITKQGLSSRPRVWQTNYYDHVIRNGADLQRIHEYIVNNPASWELDRFYREVTAASEYQ